MVAVVGAADTWHCVGRATDGEDIRQALGGRERRRALARTGQLKLMEVKSDLTNVGGALVHVKRTLAGCRVGARPIGVGPIRVVQRHRRSAG